MTDEHLWLEDVDGERALDWVRHQNERSLAHLEAHPRHDRYVSAATTVLTTEDRIAYAAIRDGFAYNFWQDDQHVKGIWRRSPVAAYLTDAPEWEILLDIDALSSTEGENWVYAGASPLWIGDDLTSRYLLTLSIGGRDAATTREFDLETGEFVEDGFVSPEAKQSATWLDPATVLIATDWGEDTMTESGYPLSVRRWNRGDDLASAHELFRGDTTDVGVWPFVLRRADGSLVAGAAQRVTFFAGAYWLFAPDDADPVRLPIPDKSDINGTFADQVLVSLQEDWRPASGQVFRSGDLVSFDLGAFLTSGSIPVVQLVFRPTQRQAVQAVAVTSEGVLLGYSDNVASRVAWLNLDDDGSWTTTPVGLPGAGEAAIAYSDPREATVLLSYQDFLTPDSLYRLDRSPSTEPQLVRAGTSHFDARGLTVNQRFARSTDGTEVPYFLIHRDDVSPGDLTPTLLYGYGGFEVSMTPSYSPTTGRLWLEQGGAYVLANIRGGGEFGPDWHQAGLKQNRQIIYDDFIAVAQDLIDNGVTSPERLGIMGGSNGGLLMGVMLTQRPDLWNAVVVQVPLLDMLRYHLLLAGASWVDEYGSPDIADERRFLETISPYHRFDPDADYPEPFFVTSTKDDRVHPGHARKMAKHFEDAGKAFLYFENIDGGHGAATTQIERAKRVALEFTYLTEKLMG